MGVTPFRHIQEAPERLREPCNSVVGGICEGNIKIIHNTTQNSLGGRYKGNRAVGWFAIADALLHYHPLKFIVPKCPLSVEIEQDDILWINHSGCHFWSCV
jgi:hypothetical protein